MSIVKWGTLLDIRLIEALGDHADQQRCSIREIAGGIIERGLELSLFERMANDHLLVLAPHTTSAAYFPALALLVRRFGLYSSQIWTDQPNELDLAASGYHDFATESVICLGKPEDNQRIEELQVLCQSRHRFQPGEPGQPMTVIDRDGKSTPARPYQNSCDGRYGWALIQSYPNPFGKPDGRRIIIVSGSDELCVFQALLLADAKSTARLIREKCRLPLLEPLPAFECLAQVGHYRGIPTQVGLLSVVTIWR